MQKTLYIKLFPVTKLVTVMSYDTVNFRLLQSEVSGVNFLEELPCYLSDLSKHTFESGVVFVGSLDGYKVSVNEYQVKIKDASLCKWYLGDNFKDLSRKDTQQAIEKMSDLLHLPVDKANITRLDFAINIITKHPVSTYTSHLGTLSHYNRLVQPTGVYYVQNNEKMVLYDKVREQKKAGFVIPDLYDGRNVLRIEQRYTNRVADRLKVKEVLGSMLYEDKFLKLLYKRLGNTFELIKKINDVQLNFEVMKSKKDLYKMGVLSLIQQAGGLNEMLDQIKDEQQKGNLTKKQALDLRCAVNEANSLNTTLVVQNENIVELCDKVKKAVNFNLRC